MTKARATGTTGGAKGALVVGTGSTTAAPLTVGTDGQLLTASSTSTTGVAWTTVSNAPTLQQTFTSSGTFTSTGTVTTPQIVYAVCVGGGAGGASGGTNDRPTFYGVGTRSSLSTNNSLKTC
jgi:hypothetical protein